jgi:hypothetical protein
VPWRAREKISFPLPVEDVSASTPAASARHEHVETAELMPGDLGKQISESVFHARQPVGGQAWPESAAGIADPVTLVGIVSGRHTPAVPGVTPGYDEAPARTA